MEQKSIRKTFGCEKYILHTNKGNTSVGVREILSAQRGGHEVYIREVNQGENW